MNSYIWEMSEQVSRCPPLLCLFLSTFLTSWELFSEYNWTGALKVDLGGNFPWLPISLVLSIWTSRDAVQTKGVLRLQFPFWGCRLHLQFLPGWLWNTWDTKRLYEGYDSIHLNRKERKGNARRVRMKLNP